ncbi:hypothetical protein ACPEEZ_13235 [Frigoribacterium sp. 2-23]|uniref:hypothetical protein n=1 Tax=Frigoribacterium sp. 2-23 TaxID=3415006 RepID=UPI003C6EC357
MSRAVVGGYTALGTSIAGGTVMVVATARLAETGALPFRGRPVESFDFTAAVSWLLGLALVVGGVVVALATVVDAVAGRQEQPENPQQTPAPLLASRRRFLPDATPEPVREPSPLASDSQAVALSSPS